MKESSYVFLMTLLVTLGGIQYQGSSDDPFHQHPMVMLLFLTTACIYAMAFTLSQISADIDDRRSMILRFLCHASGILANELLLWILVNPPHRIIINASLILVAVALYVFPVLYNSLLTCSAWIYNYIMGREVEADVEIQIPGLEAAAHVEAMD